MARIIVCVDIDAFFASVEQQDNPALKGKPIAVTGAGERTVIMTSSYEARAYGVKTGMTVYEAKRLCPHIILIVVRQCPMHGKKRFFKQERDASCVSDSPLYSTMYGVPGPVAVGNAETITAWSPLWTR